jgi:cell division protein FtsB
VKWLAAGLFTLLLLLQYRLWFAEGSRAELARLEAKIEAQQTVNAGLSQRNRKLELEVLDLQRGLDSLEERARQDLGMIREGETFYQIVDKPKVDPQAEPGDAD